MRLHGLFNIEVEDNLIVSHFYGAWNSEQTRHYAEQVKTLSSSLHNEPWARVINLSDWEGGGEEILAPLRELHTWSLENKCRFVVFVRPSMLPKFMLEKYGSGYGSYQIFESLQEAKNWAKQELAHL